MGPEHQYFKGSQVSQVWEGWKVGTSTTDVGENVSLYTNHLGILLKDSNSVGLGESGDAAFLNKL